MELFAQEEGEVLVKTREDHQVPYGVMVDLDLGKVVGEELNLWTALRMGSYEPPKIGAAEEKKILAIVEKYLKSKDK